MQRIKKIAQKEESNFRKIVTSTRRRWKQKLNKYYSFKTDKEKKI